MAIIIPSAKISSFTKTFSSSKHHVLAGGCFDLLHNGHISFLKKAKEEGDFLIILLESDVMIKKRKSANRPIETQQVRAEKLSNLNTVDLIILLPDEMKNDDYDNLVSALKPAIIATTKGDPGRHHKERQAKLVRGEVKDVITRLPEYSTTKEIKTHVNE